jgi:phosphoenolpyruvate carboxykinase (GTP)
MKDNDGKPVLGANPNSRFTVPIANCPTASYRLDQHHGVPISAIIFGGRRQRLAPLIFEALSWQHGVFIGAAMASERTAAQVGKLGEVRRDPMAMLPFCGYNMADYFRHWIEMGKRIKKQPRIFHVNWFRTDENGKFLWPGFGENLRVLEWILNRCEDRVGAVSTPIGYVPRPEDLDISGLKMPDSVLHKLLGVGNKDWLEELEGIKTFFKQFGKDLPEELWSEYERLSSRLKTNG